MPGSPFGTGMRGRGNPLRKLLKQVDVFSADFGIFGHLDFIKHRFYYCFSFFNYGASIA